MRRAFGAGLALVLAAQTVRADPGVPQLDAAHLQREDAQRIDEQQRRVDPKAPSLDAEPQPQPAPSAPSAHDSRVTGIVLLGVGATAAVLSTTLFTANALDDTDEHPTRKTFAALLGVGAVTAAIVGVAFLVAGNRRAHPTPQTVQLAPMASPEAVGLTAVGRF